MKNELLKGLTARIKETNQEVKESREVLSEYLKLARNQMTAEQWGPYLAGHCSMTMNQAQDLMGVAAAPAELRADPRLGIVGPVFGA